MADPIFAEPRLARLYDVVDDDRRDLDVYVEIVGELSASTVLDVGCGTGTLACELARRGIEVIGVDPAGRPSRSLVASPALSTCFRSTRMRNERDNR